MTEFISVNRNSKDGMVVGYFDLLQKIDAEIMRPTAEAFDRLTAGCLHPTGPWERPDPCDCHWPGDRPVSARKPDGGKRYVWIRHDVDDHIDRSWEMALAEHEHGVSSVYFFLNTAPYFRWAAFLDMARDFVRAGHTIGLHNNSVTAAYKMNDPKMAESILARDLSYLRVAGDIWITASHGDVWNRHHNVLNYEMFTECRRRGVFPNKPLAHYGLKYEAYSTPHTFYLGDSGGRWSGFDSAGTRHENPFDLVEVFNAGKNGVMQLLVHPQWWKRKEN